VPNLIIFISKTSEKSIEITKFSFFFFHFLENIWPSWEILRPEKKKALKGRPLVIFLNFWWRFAPFWENYFKNT
jgi:hypothetical protein